MTHKLNMMGRFCSLASVLILIAAPEVIHGQQVIPAGVVSRRHAASVTGSFSAVGLSRGITSDSAQTHPWRWIGGGALVGAATGGIVAAVSVSRTDDVFLPGQAIAAVAAVGGVVGGLLGGLLYLVFH